MAASACGRPSRRRAIARLLRMTAMYVWRLKVGGHAAGRVRVRPLCPPYALRYRRLRHADAPQARKFYRRAAEVEAEYRAKKIDLKALDPAGGEPEIAV